MKVTILVDNVSHNGIPGEWGFSAYIEHKGNHILLDTGASDLFLENAEQLGLSIEDVDYAVLSHAHYDHSNGMACFFEHNGHAKFFLQEGAKENCYFKKFILKKYIGLPKEITKQYPDRIEYVSGLYHLCEDACLLSHTSPGLEKIGKRESMYQKTARGWRPDNFCHEQNLILDTDDGLVIFNSCSHGGVINSINEVKLAFPGRKLKAFIGGFHIFSRPENEIRELAEQIRKTGVEQIYTGHCSKERGCSILKDVLGDMVHSFYVGLELSF